MAIINTLYLMEKNMPKLILASTSAMASRSSGKTANLF
ncbi:FIG146278: Maf/YceF/YhdE family protein [Escherichia coli IS9]|nr:FIG146278: Maf/YceF/YhdE family protein [Escherichia coli IS9]CDK77842.1 FIG146278: Maf/YceF/YhdE family protein [Klebsiella pneumoniae IS22]